MDIKKAKILFFQILILGLNIFSLESYSQCYLRFQNQKEDTFEKKVANYFGNTSSTLPKDKEFINEYKTKISSNPIFSATEMNLILKVGNRYEIFCMPWLFTFDEIVSHLNRGYFDAPLLHFLDNYERDLRKIKMRADEETIKSIRSKIKSRERSFLSNFPSEIELRSQEFGIDFSHRFDYFLNPDDHLIYTRLRPNTIYSHPLSYIDRGNLIDTGFMNQDIGMIDGWYLHDHTGGPKLPEGEFVEKMVSQGEIIIAVSNSKRVYIYKPTNNKGKVEWEKKMGAPFMRKLSLLPNTLDFTFGLSVAEKPKTRDISHMAREDIVEYWEDEAGQKIEFGFTATLYLITKDHPNVIRYWDTGLPTSFSRGFLTPDKGRVMAQKISSAGSTVMILGVDKEGNTVVYTRMYDYELNGTCPGLRVSYHKLACVRYNQEYEGQKQPLMVPKRLMPLKPWEKHALPQGVKLTDTISIILTGQGNDARELRIQGENAEGIKGYFYKAIAADSWEFKPLVSDNYPESTRQEKEAKTKYSKNRVTYDYESTDVSVLFGLENNIKSVRIENFHIYQTQDQPSKITFNLTNGNVIKATLYTGEIWFYLQQLKSDPEAIGTSDGPPKLLFGTLSFDEKSRRENIFPELLSYHKVPNSFVLISSHSSITLRSRNFTRNSNDYMDFNANLKPIKIDFKNVKSQLIYDSITKLVDGELANVGVELDSYLATSSYYIQMAMDSKLLINNDMDIETLKHKLELNNNAIKGLNKSKDKIFNEYFKKSFSTPVALAALNVVNSAISLGNFTKKKEELEVVTDQVPSVTFGYTESYLDTIFNKDHFKDAKKIIYARIKAIKALIKEKEKMATTTEQTSKKY